MVIVALLSEVMVVVAAAMCQPVSPVPPVTSVSLLANVLAALFAGDVEAHDAHSPPSAFSVAALASLSAHAPKSTEAPSVQLVQGRCPPVSLLAKHLEMLHAKMTETMEVM